jgi:hypothetical protein
VKSFLLETILVEIVNESTCAKVITQGHLSVIIPEDGMRIS